MPIFEYKCGKCGKISEFLESHSSKPKICSHCGSKKLQKRISTFAFGVKQGDSQRCRTCTDETCPHSGH